MPAAGREPFGGQGRAGRAGAWSGPAAVPSPLRTLRAGHCPGLGRWEAARAPRTPARLTGECQQCTGTDARQHTGAFVGDPPRHQPCAQGRKSALATQEQSVPLVPAVEVMQLLSVMQGGPNAEQVALPPPFPPPSPFYVLPRKISWVYGVEDSDVSLLLPQLRSWLAIPCCQYVWHCPREPQSSSLKSHDLSIGMLSSSFTVCALQGHDI